MRTGILAAWLLAAGLACAGGDGATAPPDVVLIDVESLRVDHLSHAGYARPTAVGLDRLREQAVLFTHVRAPSSASPTSTASLLTGLSPTRHGVGGSRPHLGDAYATLVEVLADAGWTTAGVSHHAGVSRVTGFARGFAHFESATGPLDRHPDASKMVAWLREWLANDPPHPFLLYLKLMNARGPYRVPEAHRATLLGRPPSLALPFDGPLANAARKPGRWRAKREIRDVHVRSLVEQYDTALRYTLDRVGEMLSMLEQTGRLDHALVVVTSTHGEELFDHQGFGSGHTLHEELLRVPLYVKLPDASARAVPEPRRAGHPAAATVDAPISLQDVVPTVLDLLGVEAPPTDGVSLAPLLRGEVDEPPERDFVHDLAAVDPQVRESALLRGRYKLIDAELRADGARNRALLYDLTLDPTEQHDLAAESAELVAELRAALRQALRPAR